MPRPLDGFHHHALVACARACDPARNDLAALGDKLGAEAPKDHLLIIDESCFVHAKHADFTSRFTELAGLAARFAG